MPSIIEGYNYDIFISYRQKDNKGDRWVSEFVESLKTELESTFKEEISVYFDINPHDGLLETHDVDESLKEKLKCLVFIPIISRTYCDPKSFAWEHEFKAFIKQASNDQFGLKVKLSGGNVASRVLPVRIHDLDTEDIKLCESVLGGVLRGVEFIYKESGFNRPLKPDDDEKVNLYKTKYRNQITKVALAVKEINLGMKVVPISGLKEKMQEKESFKEILEEEKRIDREKPAKSVNRKLLYTIPIIALLIVAGIIAYPKIFKKDTLENLREKGKISVAVMPFQNMTNDTTKNFWQEMIQDNLINALTNSEELIVRQNESIITLLKNNNVTNYASITPSIGSSVSQKLDANVFVHGSINQVGRIIRLNARLINSKTEEVIKSFHKDGTEENILPLIDTLSSMVRDFLIISKLKSGGDPDFEPFVSTNSPEAYKFFLYGENERRMFNNEFAAKYYSQAIALDSNFVYAVVMLSYSYINLGIYDQPKSLYLKIYRKREMLDTRDRIWTDILHSYLFETPLERITYFRQLQRIDNQNPIINFQIGYTYFTLSQNVNAIREYENALKIYNDWDSKPYWVNNYTNLGLCYHLTGQFRKEKQLYTKAEKYFPGNQSLLRRWAILALSEGRTKAADKYIGNYLSILKDNSLSEAAIASDLAGIYSESGMLDEAEEYYRQAFSLEPVNPNRMNTLAYFKIDKDRNINEGIELVSKALELRPDNYNFLHTYGWGLYKQGKHKEALEILQKSWDLRREKAIYNHEAYLHLEAAKKAVASQKNN